ncbi:MAG: hypothetical protein HUJ68_08725 [Clostridia bacterium]|nr:hypothetical protein [Clostridia bacterium]
MNDSKFLEKFPFIIVKDCGESGWWYEGADATLEAASRTLFYSAKNSSVKMMKIVHVTSQKDLDDLRAYVHNVE